MPTRLVHMVIDAAEPARLARFWAAALGWEMAAEEPEVANVLPPDYSYPDPVAQPLVLLSVPEPKSAKNRVHLNLATESPAQQAAEVGRLLSLGAVLADVGRGDVPWKVLADPEGNEFCVLDPRPVYGDTGPVAAIVADCVDLDAMADFWELAAGWTRRGSSDGRVMLRSPSGTGPFLELQRVPDAKTVKNRVHFDVAPEKGEDLAEAVGLLRHAGAVAADVGQRDVSWEVMADPEGNEFCVLTPR
jgi:predicted enzyme related to lactoylglutathione lyase